MNRLCIFLFVTVFSTSVIAQDCDYIRKSSLYFSATCSGATENEARINALSLLAENISSVVSSRTDMLTKDNDQKFYNASKSTSVLHLKGISYITCDRNRKSGPTVVAFISKNDLQQSSTEVADRVHQYLELMEQKEANGIDYLPEAYIAYLHTFMSPYSIDYRSDKRNITNVRGYLESFLRTYLSNVEISCTGVRENADYPDQQLTLSLLMSGTNGTRMNFQLDIPEYAAKGTIDPAANTMDIIMAPDGKKTRFSGTLSLMPPPVESDLKDISDRVKIGRDINFEADMSDVIAFDINAREQGENILFTPVTRHLNVRQFEWISEGKLLSTEPRLVVPAAGLRELTLRLNGNHELMVTKTFDIAASDNMSRQVFKTYGPSITIETLPSDAQITAISTQFPDNATVIVTSDLPDLTFRSSMGAIERQTYNPQFHRYEILIKPVKQLFFVEAPGITEKSMGVVNVRQGEASWFRITAAPADALISKGLVNITSDPPNASIFINDMETVYRTPFTIMVADGVTKISLRKNYYHPLDTVIRVDASHPVDLAMRLTRDPNSYPVKNNRDNAISYLKGQRERTYYEDIDPAESARRQQVIDYNRKILLLKRKAALSYTLGGMGILMGAGYHWLDNMIYDNSRSSTSRSSVLGTFSTASYIMGGVGIISGIICSTKIAHLKKNWEITPPPNARVSSNSKGDALMGIGIIFKF